MNYSLTEKQLDKIVQALRRKRDAASKEQRLAAAMAFDHAIGLIQDTRHTAAQSRHERHMAALQSKIDGITA